MVSKELYLDDWQHVKLSEVIEKVIDNRGKTPPLSEEGYRLIEANQIKESSPYILDNGNSQKFVDKNTFDSWFRSGHPREGDILVTTVGNIGSTAIVTPIEKICIAQNVVGMRCSNKINAKFLLQYTKSSLFKQQINRVVMNAVQPSLKVPHLLDIGINVPPVIEQKKIAAILTSVDDTIEKTEAIIKQTEVVKRGLMQQLLTKGIGHTSFKKTEIGEIPTEWQVLTLGEMLENGMILGHQDGNHGELYPRSEEFTEQGVPYLSANCIRNAEIDFALAKFLPIERASKFKKGVARNSDVLFAHNATVGPVTVLTTDLDCVVLSTTLTYYRCNEESINPYYLSQYMSSPMFVSQYTRVMGQTTRNQVPLTLQRKFLHVIPPVEEQKRITDILTSVDNKIKVEKSKLSALIQMKHGLLQILLMGKIRVNVDEPYEVSV